MEKRKITIISTTTQSTKVILSGAETLGELKEDLRQAGIATEDMIFHEGLSRTDMERDDALLPKDVPYRGNVTNELVFMLTKKHMKVASGGISQERRDIYDIIHNMELEEEVRERFGKNKTQVPTSQLKAFLEGRFNREGAAAHEPEEPMGELSAACHGSQWNERCFNALRDIEGTLRRIADLFQRLAVEAALKGFEVPREEELESPYSQEELEDMF